MAVMGVCVLRCEQKRGRRRFSSVLVRRPEDIGVRRWSWGKKGHLVIAKEVTDSRGR